MIRNLNGQKPSGVFIKPIRTQITRGPVGNKYNTSVPRLNVRGQNIDVIYRDVW